ncbi:hypothetical protein [Pseudonocardia asaccharolytica]|uniref:Uncharacterized protein n=1 Tax=Pseudonocardia asaccharolytica DSM 44247 = NBRC 16224 TaxID=1123024 RepID=A0A511D3K8_9PSEU|nr:hypothetical protein [Pseudonocardia asaccharolytica]GEL19093.1 hypothetical protein PA7_29300 [Pseudonocardia asaccharolytica DSM 44247 = NBRC 16224]
MLLVRTHDLHRPVPGGFAEIEAQPVGGFGADTDTNVFDTDVWVLPVRLAALGIDPAARSAPLRFQMSVFATTARPQGGRRRCSESDHPRTRRRRGQAQNQPARGVSRPR